MRSGSEWPSFNGGYNATRFSSLSQINADNVTSLAEVARFKLPEHNVGVAPATAYEVKKVDTDFFDED